MRMSAVADLAHIPYWHGSEVDLGILEAAYVHSAAAAPGCTVPSDIFGRRIREHDLLATPLQLEGEWVQVPSGPGLGVELDLSPSPPTKTRGLWWNDRDTWSVEPGRRGGNHRHHAHPRHVGLRPSRLETRGVRFRRRGFRGLPGRSAARWALGDRLPHPGNLSRRVVGGCGSADPRGSAGGSRAAAPGRVQAGTG